MSANTNVIALSGNIVFPPELKETASGFSVLKFRIAVNKSKKNEAGEWVDEAIFIDCKVLGNRARALAQYLEKGMKVFVAGTLDIDEWTGRDGTKKRDAYVIATSVDWDAKGRAFVREQPVRSKEEAMQVVQEAHAMANGARPDESDVYDEAIPF